jgi:hypothetical protein
LRWGVGYCLGKKGQAKHHVSKRKTFRIILVQYLHVACMILASLPGTRNKTSEIWVRCYES